MASGAFAESANSNHFSSVASPRWRGAFLQCAPVAKLGAPVLAIGSNNSPQPTAHSGG